jgi:hypothetical protein
MNDGSRKAATAACFQGPAIVQQPVAQVPLKQPVSLAEVLVPMMRWLV